MNSQPATGAPTTNIDTAVAFVDRYCAAWNSHDPHAILELTVGDAVRWHDPTIDGGQAEGAAAVERWLRGFWRAFPDMTFAYEYPGDARRSVSLSGDGQHIIAQWRCRGTMLGPIDPPGFAATGRPVELTGIDEYEFINDKLSRVKTVTDVHSALRQVGLLPSRHSLAERTLVRLQRATQRLR